MLKRIAGMVVAAMLAAPALAQDVQPVFDLPELARGQVITSTANGYANRGSAKEGSTRESRARATCANKGRAATNMGRDHPKVRQLYRLCRQAGY